MLHRALEAHATAKQSAQTAPSDRPGDVSSSPRRPVNAAFKPPRPFQPLQPAQPAVYNGVTNKASQGIKRTAAGVAKSLYKSNSNGFSESTATSNTSQSSDSKSYVTFDDNDFDDDIDIDIEEPKLAKSTLYPKLPNQKHGPPAYPSIRKATLHTQADHSNNLSAPAGRVAPSSSNPLPWSSSPVEHYAARQTARQLQSNYPAKHTSVDLKDATNHEDTVTRNAPAAKRRTLPWLQNKAQVEEYDETSFDSTDLPGSPLPPNTPGNFPVFDQSASAVKAKQKKLREEHGRKQAAAAEAATSSNHAASSVKRAQRVVRVLLSNEQRQILDLVKDKNESVFFTGSAGTGKSVLLREIIAQLRQAHAKETDRIAVTASTGLAACNIGGVTLHSFAGIGLGKEDVDTLLKKIRRNQKAKHRWMRTKVLVIDEVSMVDGELFDKLEEIARRLRNNGRPFGGIQLVITGDFFQLPPVPEPGRQEARFCFDAATWRSSIRHTIALHHVFRQRDSTFADMLNEMREGRLSDRTVAAFKKLDRNNVQGGVELFPRRQDVDTANTQRMTQLRGEVYRFQARDGGTIVDKAARDKLLQNCMAPELLELKKGSQVMLIKNIDETLVNGSLGTVIGFMDERLFDNFKEHPELFAEPGLASAPITVHDDSPSDSDPEHSSSSSLAAARRRVQQQVQQYASTAQAFPLVRFSLANGTTRDLLCQRETWKIELPNGEIQASRAQVPLILAWALSIHKAQGQTLERVRVDLTKVFEKGQAYVALSRATSMQGLQVIGFDPNKVLAHPKVRTFYAGLSKVASTAGAVKGEDEEY